MKPNIYRKSIACCFIFVAIFSTTTTLAQEPDSFELSKGVLVDTKGQTLFVSHRDGGIDNILMSSGLVNWHTNSADRPIITRGSQLIAHKNTQQKGQITLSSIDIGSGILKQNHSITVSTDIIANVKEGPSNKFKIFITKENSLNGKIQWQYQSKANQGMFSEKTPNPKNFYGEISLHNNNQLTSSSSLAITRKPQRHNNEIEGAFLSNVPGRQFKSIDGRHILVSRLKNNQTQWNKYSWEIYKTTGETLGSISHFNSYSAFYVNEGVIIFVNLPFVKGNEKGNVSSPLQLQAFSLASGDNLWNREIRDLSFRGPYPH